MEGSSTPSIGMRPKTKKIAKHHQVELKGSGTAVSYESGQYSTAEEVKTACLVKEHPKIKIPGLTGRPVTYLRKKIRYHGTFKKTSDWMETLAMTTAKDYGLLYRNMDRQSIKQTRSAENSTMNRKISN